MRAAYLADNLYVGTFDGTLIWLIRQEASWLMGEEVGTFIVDTILAWASWAIPEGPGTDWWFTP